MMIIEITVIGQEVSIVNEHSIVIEYMPATHHMDDIR